MNGSLRSDLFADMLSWEQRSDLTLSLGTSMCGMNSDRVFTTVANRALRGEQGCIGGVIISLQQTQHDSLACLRIFAKLDIVMQMLCLELGLSLPEQDQITQQPIEFLADGDEDVFQVRYASNGMQLPPVPPLQEKKKKHRASRLMHRLGLSSAPPPSPPLTSSLCLSTLDLRMGARVRLVAGPYAGDEGEVLGKNREGHYRIQIMHKIGPAGTKRPFELILGKWWIESAVQGTVPSIPVVNCV
jgi:hypothetical protein